MTITHTELMDYLRGRQWLVQNGYIPKYNAVFCDPPYSLISINKRFGKPDSAPAKDRVGGPFVRVNRGFMGKEWDGFDTLEDFQSWVTEWATLMLDFVHPGAVGLFFGGSRTFHRLACGLEDAGWQVDDVIVWMHGQGFPKSLSLSKALGKEAGAAREVVGIGLHAAHRQSQPYGMGAKQDAGIDNRIITAPATDAAHRWHGYGTALKPAFEAVVVCRAPRAGHTYAQLARLFAAGALNIDGGRIGTNAGWSYPNGRGGTSWMNRDSLSKNLTDPVSASLGRYPANVIFSHLPDCNGTCAPGCPVDALARQSVVSGNNTYKPRSNTRTAVQFSPDNGWNSHNMNPNNANAPDSYGDTGSAARFFYQAKAATWERDAGLAGFEATEPNNTYGDGLNTATKIRTLEQEQNGVSRAKRRNVHPTVKPIQLNEYLARLILPPAGDEPRRLLVPFSGSGSEMIGAQLAGWDVIDGIEQDAEYVTIARARVAWWSQFASYDEAKRAYDKERKDTPAPPEQLPLFEDAA